MAQHESQTPLGCIARMARFAPKIPLWAIMLLCVVMVTALAPFVIVKKYDNTMALMCNQCGVKLWVSSAGLADSTNRVRKVTDHTFEHTELSRWFSANISSNCQHSWQTNLRYARTYMSLGENRLWDVSRAFGSSPRPSLIDLSADDRARLENLLRQSPDACRNFIHAALQGREVAEE
jgi:hypothetical protein